METMTKDKAAVTAEDAAVQQRVGVGLLDELMGRWALVTCS